MRRSSSSLVPALIVSALAHVGLFALALWEWPKETQHLILSAVPVTLIADTPQEAAPAPTPPAPTPEPEAPPPPAPAPPEPPKPEPVKPAPPKPTPPKPDLKPAPTKPAKAKPAANDSLDLDQVSKSFAKASPAKPSKALPNRPAPTVPGAGTAVQPTGPDKDALVGKIVALWHPNCPPPPGRLTLIKVRLKLSPRGDLERPPTLVGGQADDPETNRAMGAARAAHYSELSPASLERLSGDYLVVQLDVLKACSR
jgi:outer membrane biosynthesis protein TonB